VPTLDLTTWRWQRRSVNDTEDFGTGIRAIGVSYHERSKPFGTRRSMARARVIHKKPQDLQISARSFLRMPRPHTAKAHWNAEL
jgi:hypothetical protein